MKKRLLVIVLLNMIYVSSFGQKDISGIYSAIYGDIVVTNDSLKLIRPDSPGIPGLVSAECTYKRINNNFIEVNSTPPYILVKKGMIVEQFMDSLITDSIKLSFSIPNYKGELDISISGMVTNRFKKFDLNYSEKNKTLIIPGNIESITIVILNPIYDGELDGSYYGFRYCSLISEYEIKKSVNKIEIKIPAIDCSFFGKYYVKGDYAKVSKDSITWKGDVFIKKK